MAITHADAEQIVRAIGLILSNSTVYGAQHGVTRQAMDACYQRLTQAWNDADVSFSLSDEALSVNGLTVEQKNVLLQQFATHLEARAISNFMLKQAMSREQFGAFIEVLMAKPDELKQLGDFGGAIAAVGLNDVVTARKVTYREVTEDEEVVAKEELEKLGQGPSGSGTAEAEKANTVVAFLRGDVAPDDAGAAATVRDMGADADQLAELIMHSATVKQAEVDLEQGETLGELVVGCLTRVFDALTQDPSINTQKTKKQIRKTLVLLERALMDRLHETIGEAGSEDVARMHEAIETMEDELTIDSLTQEYVKRRQAIDNSEKRLMRFMKKKGADAIDDSDLRTRLVDAGLDLGDWQELLVKSGVADDPQSREAPPATGVGGGLGLGLGMQEGGMGALEDLAQLLDKIEQNAAPAKPAGDATQGLTEAGTDSAEEAGLRAVMLRVPEEVFVSDLQSVQAAVNRIILNTEKRIERLVEEVEGPAATEKDRTAPPQLSRKRLFEILAEIGQELCQPLSVISCSLDMILAGSLGDVSELQKEMLDLSADSAQKLKVLIDRIIAISGVPEALVVDTEIQSSLYADA